MAFAAVWEYEVRPERLDEFVALYGPEGSWVRLFERHEGYERTQLLRDRASPVRFLTIDLWATRSYYERFRASAASAYAELDRQGEHLTSGEREIGGFDILG